MRERKSSWQDAARIVTDEGGPLRLFWLDEVECSRDGGNGNELTPQMRLSEFYERFYMRVVEVSRSNSHDTREQNAASIRLWAASTGDPPLAAIDEYACSRFIDALQRSAKINSQTTIAKHASAVQKVLNFAGPPTPQSRQAKSLLANVPYIERPSGEQVRLDEPFTFAELEKLVLNTHQFKMPDWIPVPTEIYVLSLFAFLYNTGMRIQETILMLPEHDQGDKVFIPSSNRKGRTKKHYVDLNEGARWALDLVKPCVCKFGRSYCWPRKWASKGSLFEAFQDYRMRLLPAHRRPIAFHGFRRLHNVELARINAKACEKALGNTATVNAQSYISRDFVREARGKIPQPRVTQERQLSLF